MTIALTIAAALLLIVSLIFAYAAGSVAEEYVAIIEGHAPRLTPDRPMLLKKGATRCFLIAGCADVAAFILLVLT